MGTREERQAARLLSGMAVWHSPHTGGSSGSGPLSSQSGSFNLASIENVNGFGERPLPSEFSSSLSVQTWESCKRGRARVTSAVWVEGAECTGKAGEALRAVWIQGTRTIQFIGTLIPGGEEWRT